MATTWTLKQHDTWPAFTAQLNDQNGPLDLTNAAVGGVKLLLKTATGSVTAGGVCTVTDAVNGKISYQWISGDTVNVNTFNGEVEITWTNGKVTTVPNVGYFTVSVVADLG